MKTRAQLIEEIIDAREKIAVFEAEESRNATIVAELREWFKKKDVPFEHMDVDTAWLWATLIGR